MLDLVIDSRPFLVMSSSQYAHTSTIIHTVNVELIGKFHKLYLLTAKMTVKALPK